MTVSIRHLDVHVQYVSERVISDYRDALIASVLDGVRASGNRDVCVKMKFTSRGYRLGPFTVPVDEEVESQLLKFIQQPPGEEGLGFSLIHYTIFHYFFSARYKIENLQKWCKYVTYFICVKFWILKK